MIRSCTCSHKGQDALHGAGKRVFNLCPAKDRQSPTYRCTVCGVTRLAEG